VVGLEGQEVGMDVGQGDEEVFPATESENGKKIPFTTSTGQETREHEREEQIKGKILS